MLGELHQPKLETFSDAKASAIKAGYGPAYAAEIKLTSWFKGRERRLRMRDKGEEVLEEMLNMPVLVTTYTGLGHDKTPVVVTEPALVRIKQDTAKFAAERLGKDEWSGSPRALRSRRWSDRNPRTQRKWKQCPRQIHRQTLRRT